MAKRGRGRPPKPKIEIEKNRVGRPTGGKDITGWEHTAICGAWIYTSLDNPNMTQLRKKVLISEKFSISIAKIEKQISMLNKMHKRGHLHFVKIDDEWNYLLFSENAMTVDDAKKAFLNGDDSIGKMGKTTESKIKLFS